MSTPDPHRLARRPGVAPARAAGENRTGSRPNLAAAGRTPPDRHQDTPEGAGANSGQEPTTAEETTMADQTRDRVADLHQRITATLTTLHALAEECEAHASEWDQRDDPDGHAAAWDALHTLLTAAGAWVEHLAKMAWVEHLAKIRPDLAPAEADDIVTAVRRLATHLTAEGSDHHG